MSAQLELFTDRGTVTELYVGACERNDVELQTLAGALLTLVHYHDRKLLAEAELQALALEQCPQ